MLIRVVALMTFMFLTLGVAIAQDKPTRVVLMLTDGTTASGEFIEATPAIVSLKPNPKAEPMSIPWSRIKRVSNGLTREAIVKDWQATRAELLCEPCKGEAATPCVACAGSGVDPAAKQDCEPCKATGITGPCKTPRCVEGKVPCPSPCLKAESFSGAPDAEGKRWRSFRGKSGIMKISDGHIGEIVVIEKGEPVNKGRCPRCEGTSRIVDTTCKGTSQNTCKPCKGHGIIGPACPSCIEGKQTCDTCKGTGLKSAPTPETPAVQTPTEPTPGAVQ